jgi:hypothetical protein
MNISHWLASVRCKVIRCPDCRSVCRRHGCYVRKGFHREPGQRAVVVDVIRYRCTQLECSRYTFSVLPPLVLPYCRFFWPDLLRVEQHLLSGKSRNALARAWVSWWAVFKRAALLLERMRGWVAAQYREEMDGAAAEGLAPMVRTLVAKLGRVELVWRWYRHCYPGRTN